MIIFNINASCYWTGFKGFGFGDQRFKALGYRLLRFDSTP